MTTNTKTAPTSDTKTAKNGTEPAPTTRRPATAVDELCMEIWNTLETLVMRENEILGLTQTIINERTQAHRVRQAMLVTKYAFDPSVRIETKNGVSEVVSAPPPAPPA